MTKRKPKRKPLVYGVDWTHWAWRIPGGVLVFVEYTDCKPMTTYRLNGRATGRWVRVKVVEVE